MKQMDDAGRMRTKKQGSSNEYQRHMYKTTYQRKMKEYETRRQDKMMERSRIADFKREHYNHQIAKRELMARAMASKAAAMKEAGSNASSSQYKYSPPERGKMSAF